MVTLLGDFAYSGCGIEILYKDEEAYEFLIWLRLVVKDLFVMNCVPLFVKPYDYVVMVACS